MSGAAASKKSERRGSSSSSAGGGGAAGADGSGGVGNCGDGATLIEDMPSPRVTKKMRTDSTSPTLAGGLVECSAGAAAAAAVDEGQSQSHLLQIPLASKPPLHVTPTPSPPVPMQTSPDAPGLPSPLSVTSMRSSSSVASANTPTNAPAAAAANTPGSGSGSGSNDMRSVLKQAALERAARHKRAPSNSTAATGGGAAAAQTAASPSPLGSECVSPPAVANANDMPGRPLRAPGHLRLNIASPQGSGSGSMQIATPVIYVEGALASPTGSVSASPRDELAGFSRSDGCFPSYATPPSLPVSAPSSRSGSGSGGGGGGGSGSGISSATAVACPLCTRSFPLSVIETHASTCDGRTDDSSEVRISDMPVAAGARAAASAESASASSAASSAAAPRASVSSVAPTSFSISSTPPSIPLPFFPRHHDTLRLLTYNLWFDDFAQQLRLDAIGSIIAAEQPHIIALQEVTDSSLAMIQRAEWARHYHVSSTPPAPYFTLLLSKFPMHSLRRLPFQSQMARDLLCCTIEVPTSSGPRRLSIATSHLESERKRSHVRRQQLDAALRLLSQAKQNTPTALFVGDMNLSGSELADVPARYGWLDAWLHAHGNERGTERRGATYDTKANTMLASRNRTGSAGYQARLDRIWIRFGSGKNVTKSAAAAAATSSSSAAGEAAPAAVPATEAATAASATDSTAAAAEWRVTSLERVGLCPLDVTQAKRYAQTCNYKQLQSPSSAAATATASTPAAAAAVASSSISSRVHTLSGWGSLSASNGTAASSTPVFPSDHFGLLITLQVADGPDGSSALPAAPIAK